MASRLHVDPIACDGRGLCAELMPEVVSLDEWGFPIVSEKPLPSAYEKDAKRAVAMCPTLALQLRPAVNQPELARRSR